MIGETRGRAMLASLHGYWEQAEDYQRFLYVVGGLLVFSAVFHTGVLIATGGSLEGDVSWRKPILFGESFGLTALSVAWVMTFLPKWRFRGWLLLGTLGFANFGEVLWVVMQQWRGVPSHFNNNTPLDAALFGVAGILIAFTGSVILVVTLLTFFSLQAPPSVRLAIRVGMVLLVFGQVFGMLIILNDGNAFGTAGAMKVPHALALHGAQVLPLLAWLLLFTEWSEVRRTQTVAVGALGYAGLLVVEAVQTFSGLAPFDLGFGAASVSGIGAIFLMGAYGTAVIGLQKAQTG